jgi:Holliday junction DNA helicase RuvA
VRRHVSLTAAVLVAPELSRNRPPFSQGVDHIEGVDLVVEKTGAASVLDVSGVGYHALHSLTTFEDLPELGATVTLLTHLHVREDALQLYGFSRAEERAAFELLLSVSGVGPKLALAVLSGLAPAAFARAVKDENLGALTRITGVGRKTAERIVVDLRDRLTGAGLVPVPAALAGAPGAASTGKAGRLGAGSDAAGPASHGLPGRLYEDAVDALTALGLTRAGAMEHVHKALDQGPAANVEELVRRALAASAKKPTSRPRTPAGV